MVGHYPCGSRQIQAAYITPDGDGITRIFFSDAERQPGCFPAKKNISAVFDGRCRIKARGMPAQNNEIPTISHIIHKSIEIRVVPNINLIPIIQTRPFEMFVIQFKTQRVDQMQAHLSCTAQSGNISGICRYFRLVKNDMKDRIFDNAVVKLCNIASHGRKGAHGIRYGAQIQWLASFFA